MNTAQYVLGAWYQAANCPKEAPSRIESLPMARRTKIYEGKAKVLYEGPEPGTIVQYFKDDATAFNAEKKDVIDGKGVLNNRLSEFFMNGLQAIGIPTHFIKRLNMREQLVRKCEIIPLEVIVRNYAAGTISKRLGIEEGTQMPRPIVEYCYKDDSLGDPLVTEEHIAAFGWASQQDMEDILSLALRVNDFIVWPNVGRWLFVWWISKLKLAVFTTATINAWSSPMKSARTAAVCGTSKQAANWTRTCSAAIWAI